jgi:hypothetical protein
MRVVRLFRPYVLAILGAVTLVACGKKGPPLAPLRLIPEAPGSVSAVRLASEAHLRFTVPSQYAGGVPGVPDLDRIEIFAVSLVPGAPAPPNRDLLTPTYLVGTVPVRPPAVEGAPASAAPDTRPGPGDVATFVEELTKDTLNPTPPAPGTAAAAPAAPATSPTGTPPGALAGTPAPAAAPAGTAAPAAPAYPVRIYALRAVMRGGRAGSPSPRVSVPLVPPPAPPSAVTVDFNEKAIIVSWTPPVAEVAGSTVLFNVYDAAAPAGPPLNPAPIPGNTFELPGVEFGVEKCVVVRTLVQVGGVPIESEASPRQCVTPRDKFAPAAPQNLSVNASPGAVSLIWDANTEPDLAGYVVLRGDAPGDTLQPLTPTPIRETVYRDTTVKPGVRYVYAVVAVDKATPPNTSPQSARVEVTASQ